MIEFIHSPSTSNWASVGVITYTSSSVTMKVDIVVKLQDEKPPSIQTFLQEPGQYISIHEALALCAARAFLFKRLWELLKTYNPLTDIGLGDFIHQGLSSLESIP